MSADKRGSFRNAQVIRPQVSFEANFIEKHVVAIVHLGKSTIGLRFESPEQMLTFFSQLIEKAATVWPDNELIKEYMSDEGAEDAK